MSVFIVTVKFPNDPKHNPAAKVTAPCRVSPECTDQTGGHHSFIAIGPDSSFVRDRYKGLGYHVTRVERAYALADADGKTANVIRRLERP